MNLFIDTNVFLSFYHFTSDDLGELEKLAVLVDRGDVNLLLPEQVVDEFRRNRANKIADALKRLRDQRLGLEFPQLCRDNEEYQSLREAQREYKRFHGVLIDRIERDIVQENLKADAVIQELFGSAQAVATSASILERARLRMDVGNPPGKKGSLGDAIVWEALLDAVAEEEDLYFISDDQDYFSPLDRASIDPFLLREWSVQKSSQMHAYRSLSGFFRDTFPEIELASEHEKDLLIEKLANSRAFRETRVVISKLSRFSDFTAAQVNEIVAAAVTNNQVYWIAGDPIVQRFLTGVVHGREDQVDPDNLRRLRYVFEEMERYGEIPF